MFNNLEEMKRWLLEYSSKIADALSSDGISISAGAVYAALGAELTVGDIMELAK